MVPNPSYEHTNIPQWTRDYNPTRYSTIHYSTIHYNHTLSEYISRKWTIQGIDQIVKITANLKVTNWLSVLEPNFIDINNIKVFVEFIDAPMIFKMKVVSRKRYVKNNNNKWSICTCLLNILLAFEDFKQNI